MQAKNRHTMKVSDHFDHLPYRIFNQIWASSSILLFLLYSQEVETTLAAIPSLPESHKLLRPADMCEVNFCGFKTFNFQRQIGAIGE